MAACFNRIRFQKFETDQPAIALQHVKGTVHQHQVFKIRTSGVFPFLDFLNFIICRQEYLVQPSSFVIDG